MKPQIDPKTGLPYWRTIFTYSGRVKETFQGFLPKLDSGLILDWGCSEGKTTDDLCGLYPGCKVYGMDVNPDEIREAILKRRRGEFLIADGYAAPFSDESFDLVFCMNNLGFALSGEDELECVKIIPRISRLVRPDGHLLVSKVESYVTLQKRSYGFRLSDYQNIYCDNSPLSMISYVLTGERPKTVPLNTPPKPDSFNSLKIDSYKDNTVRLPDYLKKSRDRILNQNPDYFGGGKKK